MKILRASDMGMCFGVRDALAVIRNVPQPEEVTIHGELVHNPVVIEDLAQSGFHQSSEEDRNGPISSPVVLITAHGISNTERKRLQSENKRLIDTTCPLVRRAHDAALELQAEERFVVLIGKPGHVEVLGITEDLHEYQVVQSIHDVRTLDHKTIGITCQTTVPIETVREICSAVRVANPQADIRFIDTVCHPTKRRQSALLELISQVDAIVVVGGQNSNNTRRLLQLCQDKSVRAVQVESAADLQPTWFEKVTTVGLTAGTSTLDSTIDEVEVALKQIATSQSSGESCEV